MSRPIPSTQIDKVYHGVKEGGVKPGRALQEADPTFHMTPINRDEVRQTSLHLRTTFVHAKAVLGRDASPRVRTPYEKDVEPTKFYLGGPRLPILLAASHVPEVEKTAEIFPPICASDILKTPRQAANTDVDRWQMKFKDYYLEQQKVPVVVEETTHVFTPPDPNFVPEMSAHDREHIHVMKTGYLTFLLQCHVDEFEGKFMVHQICKMCTRGFNTGRRDPTVIRPYRVQVRKVKVGPVDFLRTTHVEVEILHAKEEEVIEFGKRPPTAMELSDFISETIMQGRIDSPFPPNDCGGVAVGWQALVFMRKNKADAFNKPTSLLIKERLKGKRKKKK